MGRLAIKTVTAVTAVGAALAVAGCGAAATADRPASSATAPVRESAQIEATDGRLGGAVAMRPGARPRELSPGGRPDVILHHRDHPRRDGVGAGAACAGPATAPSAGTLPSVIASTLCLLNGERADRGLPPLAANPKLTAAATAYAQDLVDHSYFSHTGRDGSNVLARIKRTGYVPTGASWQLGENLAWGTGALATPGAIMQAWMNSPGHRANILKPAYREIGVGIVAGNPARTDGAGATYATTFGVIEAADPVVAQAPRAAPAQAAKASKAGRKRKRGKRRGSRAKLARKATASRHQGRGKGERRARKRRGPTARIAV
jgi:uncharacterized protein YkwD